jgi:hypothetical protein
MLADPNDESPANVDAAKEWRDNYPEFKWVNLSLEFATISVKLIETANDTCMH